MSLFDTTLAPSDAIFKLTSDFKLDPHPEKISLGVGAYRDNDGKPWVLPVVYKIQNEISQNTGLDHEYLPIEGLKSFTDASVRLILGNDVGNYAAVQTLSGTGACRLGADFLKQISPNATVYISNPTWVFNLIRRIIGKSLIWLG